MVRELDCHSSKTKGSSPLCSANKLDYGVIGNTTDFGSVIMGSSPVGPTILILIFEILDTKVWILKFNFLYLIYK